MKYFALLAICLILPACYLIPSQENSPTRPSITIPSPTPDDVSMRPTLATMNLPEGIYDALPLMQGICFESAWDAAGTLFILRNAEEHIHFYDLVDNSRLCSRPVTRYPLDFTTGNVLAGLWTRGTGCTADYSVQAYDRNDSSKTIRLIAAFSTEGECPYELVRGFWLIFEDAQDYEISIEIIQ